MSIDPSILRDIANEILVQASSLAPMDDIAARLHGLADEQERKPRGAMLGRFTVDFDAAAVERAAEQLRAAADAAGQACEKVGRAAALIEPAIHEIDGRPALFFMIRSDHPRGPAGARVSIDSPEGIDESIEALRVKAQAIAKDLRDGTNMA